MRPEREQYCGGDFGDAEENIVPELKFTIAGTRTTPLNVRGMLWTSNALRVMGLISCVIGTGFFGIQSAVSAETLDLPAGVAIEAIDPPEKEFFSKRLDFESIPIKAHQVVSNEALVAAYGRLNSLFGDLGSYRSMVLSNLARAGVELHIIGRDQVTTDLPEWRHDKGKPLAEYNGRTRDERTRGMGGRLVSCGEENLLRLNADRYRGRDICVHEFSHAIRNFGITRKIRQRFNEQYRRSLDKGRWKGSYAGSNADEFFAELSMWYFGTRGDLRMEGEKPKDGKEGLRNYDPDAYALFDEFYSGRLEW